MDAELESIANGAIACVDRLDDKSIQAEPVIRLQTRFAVVYGQSFDLEARHRTKLEPSLRTCAILLELASFLGIWALRSAKPTRSSTVHGELLSAMKAQSTSYSGLIRMIAGQNIEEIERLYRLVILAVFTSASRIRSCSEDSIRRDARSILSVDLHLIEAGIALNGLEFQDQIDGAHVLALRNNLLHVILASEFAWAPIETDSSWTLRYLTGIYERTTDVPSRLLLKTGITCFALSSLSGTNGVIVDLKKKILLENADKNAKNVLETAAILITDSRGGHPPSQTNSLVSRFASSLTEFKLDEAKVLATDNSTLQSILESSLLQAPIIVQDRGPVRDILEKDERNSVEFLNKTKTEIPLEQSRKRPNEGDDVEKSNTRQLPTAANLLKRLKRTPAASKVAETPMSTLNAQAQGTPVRGRRRLAPVVESSEAIQAPVSTNKPPVLSSTGPSAQTLKQALLKRMKKG